MPGICLLCPLFETPAKDTKQGGPRNRHQVAETSATISHRRRVFSGRGRARAWESGFTPVGQKLCPWPVRLSEPILSHHRTKKGMEFQKLPPSKEKKTEIEGKNNYGGILQDGLWTLPSTTPSELRCKIQHSTRGMGEWLASKHSWLLFFSSANCLSDTGQQHTSHAAAPASSSASAAGAVDSLAVALSASVGSSEAPSPPPSLSAACGTQWEGPSRSWLRVWRGYGIT